MRRKQDSKREQDLKIIWRRYNTLDNLHEKNVKKGGKCSYETFTLHCPFNIIFTTVEDRYTFLCFQHSNMKYKADALCKKTEEIIKSVLNKYDEAKNSYKRNENQWNLSNDWCLSDGFQRIQNAQF